MNNNLFLLASLAYLPLNGIAQTGPEAPRFYVGLGAAASSDGLFNSYNSPAIYGPALTAGVQLRPRLTVQVGASLGKQSNASSYTYTQTTPLDVYSNSYSTNIFTVPVLARYTLTDPAARFRFDALGGLTLMHYATHSTYTYSSKGQVVDHNESDYRRTNYNFSLGPGVRYALGPRVELAASAVVNLTLNGYYYGSFGDRFLLNAQLGAHYTFGS